MGPEFQTFHSPKWRILHYGSTTHDDFPPRPIGEDIHFEPNEAVDRYGLITRCWVGVMGDVVTCWWWEWDGILRIHNELRYFTPYFNSSIILNYEYPCNIDVNQIEWNVTISEFSKLQGRTSVIERVWIFRNRLMLRVWHGVLVQVL